MTVRVAINGFGRVGRSVLRAAHEQGADIEFAAVNDVADADTLAHLLKHDSVFGPFPADVEVTHLSTIRIGHGRSAARGRGRVAVVGGTVDDHALRIEALLRAGVEHVIVALDDVWEPGAVERYGELIAVASAARDRN